MSQDPSDSECTASIHFSMSMVHKYVNLKEPHKKDIKEQVTTNLFIFLKKTGFQEKQGTDGVFQTQSSICGVHFSNISINQFRFNERKTNLTRPLTPLNH